MEKWAYFFREVKNLNGIPPALSEGPFRDALEDDRARIQACAGAATLDRWVDNVFGAKTAIDVLS